MKMIQLETSEDRRNVIIRQRYYLGMFHDGLRFCVVAWNWDHQYNKFLFFFTDLNEVKVKEIEMPIKIDYVFRWAVYRICTDGQFQFFNINGSIVLSANVRHDTDNIYVDDEIGFKINCDWQFDWFYLKQNADRHNGHENIVIRAGDYSVNHPCVIRDENCNWALSRGGIPFNQERILDKVGNCDILHQRLYRNNHFTVSVNYLYYFNKSKIFVYQIEKGIIKQVAKIVPCGHVVDVKVSPDNQTLLVVTKSAAILYKVGTWENIRTLSNGKRPSRGFLYGCWSSDGLVFATMSPDFIQMWDFD